MENPAAPGPVDQVVQQPATETKQPLVSRAKNSKILLVSMSVITIISLAASGYFGYQNYKLNKQISQFSEAIPSPTADPTENWIVFTNTLYKYFLKYPATWTVKALGNANPTTFREPIFNSPCNYDDGELCQQFYVEAQKSDNPLDLEPFFIIQDDDIVTEKQNIKIDGQNAVGFVHYNPNLNTSGTLEYVVVTNFNNYKYTIFYRESQKGKEFKTSSDWNNKQLFDKVLSTFKFLESENSTSNLSDKKIGYIKSITSNYDNYSIEVDYINFIQENTAPNGYRIENPSTETVSLSTGTHGSEPLITMQTYSYDSSGNFNFNQKITFSEFLNKFNSDSNFKAVPFWIETKNGIVVQITEQYIP